MFVNLTKVNTPQFLLSEVSVPLGLLYSSDFSSSFFASKAFMFSFSSFS